MPNNRRCDSIVIMWLMFSGCSPTNLDGANCRQRPLLAPGASAQFVVKASTKEQSMITPHLKPDDLVVNVGRQVLRESDHVLVDVKILDKGTRQMRRLSLEWKTGQVVNGPSLERAEASLYQSKYHKPQAFAR